MHASHSECATRSLRLWRYAGFSFRATKLFRRTDFGASLRAQPELSLWRGRAARAPDWGVAAPDPNCWQRPELSGIASVSMSSWMLDEEESQERIGRNDVRQGQERNGEAAHGQVRARRANKSRRRIRHSVAGKEGGDPVTDWERVDDVALCVRMAADYSDEAIHCGYWPGVPVQGNAARTPGPVHGEQDSSCRNRSGRMKNL